LAFQGYKQSTLNLISAKKVFVTEKVVVLGAGFLGVNAALDLAQADKEVVLVDKDLTHQYIPSTIDLIRNRFQREELELELEEFMPEQIELKEAEVQDVRAEENTVETRHGLIGYDKLVLGLGGSPADFGMNISDADHVWGTEPAQQLSKKAENAETAIIVGGGYVGVEVAGELAEKDVQTTIIEANTRPMQYLDEESSERMLEILQNKEIQFKGGKTVSGVEEDKVLFDEGGSQEADIVIWSAGVQASKTVQDIFDVGSKGLEVNKGLSVVENEDIFAGGDCVAVGGQKTAHKAMKQGQVIAENIVSNPEPLKQAESEQDFLIVSVGNTAAIIFRNKLIYSAEFLRHFKDLVKTYYFTRLKIKKKLFNVDFLP